MVPQDPKSLQMEQLAGLLSKYQADLEVAKARASQVFHNIASNPDIEYTKLAAELDSIDRKLTDLVGTHEDGYETCPLLGVDCSALRSRLETIRIHIAEKAG